MNGAHDIIIIIKEPKCLNMIVSDNCRTKSDKCHPPVPRWYGERMADVWRGAAMRKISIRLTDQHYEVLEALVTAGEYASVSEAIRDAIRRLLTEKMEVLERSQRLGSFA